MRFQSRPPSQKHVFNKVYEAPQSSGNVFTQFLTAKNTSMSVAFSEISDQAITIIMNQGLDEADEFESGEEWKALSDEFADSDYGSLDNLIIYTVAKDLAVDVLKWAESVPAKAHTKNFQEFVGDSLKIGAKLAGGYSFGFEPEYLGANIAYTKKALACANQCLSLMTSLKSADYFTKAAYGDLNSRLFELRNDIGVYVQELRDRFRFGID